MTISDDLSAVPRDAVIELPVADDTGSIDEASLRRRLLLGMWALVAERLDQTEGAEGVLEARQSLEGSVGPLRFELHEQRMKIDALGRIARSLVSENGASRSFIVPRLHRDIEVYRRRVEALRAASKRQG